MLLSNATNNPPISCVGVLWVSQHFLHLISRSKVTRRRIENASGGGGIVPRDSLILRNNLFPSQEQQMTSATAIVINTFCDVG